MTRWQSFALLLIMLVQGLCAVFFVSGIALSYFNVPAFPIAWQTREMVELLAAGGLLIGVVLGWIVFRRSVWFVRRAIIRSRYCESQLRVASGAFLEVMEEQFTHWGLTPAEHDVALFLVKGLATSEIAEIRHTSEGTIKAQTNAIYRKAGVSGRSQLLSLFIEDLMGDALPGMTPRLIPQSA